MLPLRSGIRTIEKGETITFVKKSINEDTIQNVNIEIKKSCMSTLMFTFELEVRGDR